MSQLDQLLDKLVAANLLTVEECDQLPKHQSDPATVEGLIDQLETSGLLSTYQASRIRAGKLDTLSIGDYTIVEPLGAGGMGQVFRAKHRHLKRSVAIKMLPVDRSISPDSVERFQREMEVLAQLEHPNIVIAHDAGNIDGRPYLVMQHVEGEDLSSTVRARGPLTVKEALSALHQAAMGVHYAHQKGIIHRDLKPSNLLRDRQGTIKVLDMGLARFTNSSGYAETSDELTASGQIMGTVDYMAPEQAEDTRHADERSDIYALGCTLYSLLTGKAIYESDSLVKKILAHREEPVPSLRQKRPDVSEELDAIYQKMVAKQAIDRYATMLEVIQAIESCTPLDTNAPASSLDETMDFSAAGSIGLPIAESNSETVTAVRQETSTVRDPDHATTAFDRKQASTHNYRVPAAPPRRRRRRLGRWAFLLLLLGGGTTAGLAWYDEKYDYLQIRHWRDQLAKVTSGESESTENMSLVAGATHRGQFRAGKAKIFSLSVSPDGTTVVSVDDSSLRSWNSLKHTENFAKSADGIRQVTYSPNGGWLAGTGRVGVRIWDAIDGKRRSNLSQLTRQAECVAFSPDSQLLASASRAIVVTGVESRGKPNIFGREVRSPTAMVFRPDGELLMVGHKTGSISQWDVASGVALGVFKEQRQGEHLAVRSLCVSPGQTYMAAGDDRGTITLWVAEAERLAGRFKGHSDSVTGVVFLPGERQLVSGSRDGSVRVWDVENQTEVGRLLTGTAPVTAISLGGAGRVLACSTEAGTIDIWDIDPSQLE